MNLRKVIDSLRFSPASQTSRRRQFSVERLEDRTLLALFTVNSSADISTGTCDAAQCTLRDAVNEANNTNDGFLNRITFDPDMADSDPFDENYSIVLNSELVVTNRVIIFGPDVGAPVSISGNGTSRIFTINLPAGVDGTRLINVTLARGNGVGDSQTGHGGAVLVEGSSRLQLFDVIIRDNQAEQAGGGIAVFNDGGGLEVHESLFVGNTTDGVGGALYTTKQTLLSNVTVSGNSAPKSSGGGVVAVNTPQLFVQNSTFFRNPGNNLSLSGNATASYINTIFVAPPDGQNVELGPFGSTGISFGHNLSDDATGNLDDPNDRPNTDAKLEPLANNGSHLLTHRPQFASPAVDSGTDADAYSFPFRPPLERKDQRSVARPKGSADDIGAHELDPANLVLDWGDAPNPYPTLTVNQGPWHVAEGPRLGGSRDGESDGQPTASAGGDDGDGNDDDDGIFFATPLIPGSNATVDIATDGEALLQGWVDFNGDGDWDDAGEQVFTNLAVAAGVANRQFMVPATAPLTSRTYARFRLSTTADLGVTGIALDGEVEDYAIAIGDFDFGDAPDTGAGTGDGNYQTTIIDQGPHHHAVGPRLGAARDTEDDALADEFAEGDDFSDATNDEDGIFLQHDGVYFPGATSFVDVDLQNADPTSNYLDAWIDFNADGDFADPGEQIFDSFLLQPNNEVQRYPFQAPADAVVDVTTFARFRLSTTGNLEPTGLASDGEVEDYFVTPFSPSLDGIDYGDAPAPYPTLKVNNGAGHVNFVPNLFLGAEIDVETDGQPETTASGDDDADTADEDGVTFTDFTARQDATMTVTAKGSQGFLNAWVDYNQDGDWNDAGEQILTDQVISASPDPDTLVETDIAVRVPGSALPGTTFARVRYSSIPGLMPTGLAGDGEVEDYTVNVVNPWLQAPDKVGVLTVIGGGDLVSKFGATTDTPLSGDFNGDGKDDIGIHRFLEDNGVVQSRFLLDTNDDGKYEPGVDARFTFGADGDVPVVGDWNSDGTDEIGVKRGNRFFFDMNGDGAFSDPPDSMITFDAPNIANATPVIGDWNGDGVDDLGAHFGDMFYLDLNGNRVWDGTEGGDAEFTLGQNGDTPFAGDWNGDGTDEVGLHRGREFLLDLNGDRALTVADIAVLFGNATGDEAIIGDWDNDGTDDVGVHRRQLFFRDANSSRVWEGAGANTFQLDSDGNGVFENADTSLTFGVNGDIPVAGDFNGDGIDDIGVRRGRKFLIDANGNQDWDSNVGGDRVFNFGLEDDTPLVGDWNGNGFDSVGVHRDNLFLLDVDGDGVFDPAGVDERTQFGDVGDLPVVGDWNGDGTDTIGIYRGNQFFLDADGDGVFGPAVDLRFTFGQSGDRPIAGDWNNDGIDEVGVHRGDLFLLDVNGDRVLDTANSDLQIQFGNPATQPLIGRWNAPAQLRVAAPNSFQARKTSPAPLTEQQLQPIVAAAISLVANTVLSPAQVDALNSATFKIGDLPLDHLSGAVEHAITIDATAANFGWFVDPTPATNEEFERLGSDSLAAIADGAAAGQIDLLSVVLHELGQLLDFGLSSDANDFMQPGRRRLPQ